MATTKMFNLHGKLSSTVCSPPSLNRSRSFYRPVVAITTVEQLNKSYWAAIKTQIDAHLKKSITIRPPTSVFEPMHHLTFSASKSTAPPLCVAACELVGGSADDAINAASAIHLMHAAAFTHEHLPLSDGPMHKGSTVEHMFKCNIELLTPDGMVPFGFELLGLSEQAQKNPDKILRVIIEISGAVGSQGIVDGMYQEVLYGESQGEDDEKMVEYVCEKKEGELHACAGACGGILGGGSEEEIEKLRKFGLYVGMIQGMVNGIGKNKEGRFEIVKKLKSLALKELEFFGAKNVDQISTLLEMY
ncbi:heterodimeric geranylgeranyl pyrophosphate synthase small subunit 2, chloroplastic-like [Apium graveolens]|uniref:heterodimeric geranylgeranyl pyrophosphate synthase small subunit 2, chloroplastic-like n=1 Tax=Apium graveolens TaxID=4045 RepID=UPI003D79F792